MQWDLNGREKVGQASIFHLNGVVHKFSFIFSCRHVAIISIWLPLSYHMSNKLYNAKSYRILNYVITFLFTIIVRGQTACSFGTSTNKGRSNITNDIDLLTENLAAEVPPVKIVSLKVTEKRVNTWQ